MKKKAVDILSRPHEQYRKIKFEHQLAGIRICYTVFCLAVLFAAQKHLQVPLVTLIFFSSIALFYSFIRYFKPTDILGNKRFPPAEDWLDFLFIAVLLHLTGGVKSFFFIAYTMPICGGIMRFGLNSGIVGYAIVLALTGLLYFMNTVISFVPSPVPQSICLTAGIGTIAFVAWMVGILAEQERKLRDKIYMSSITDHLSGLYNLRYLRARIKEEIERSSRENKSFATVFIDLNNFKAVNDRHGHLVGDEVLKQVADILAKNIRKGDVLARYGGDEFALLMPGTETEQAEKVMQRIEDAVAAFTFIKSIKIGLSNGIVVFPEDGDSLDELLTAADRRMYEKKKEG